MQFWVPLIISSLCGGGLIIHIINSAFKYGRLTQKVDNLEGESERRQVVTDEIYKVLDTMREDLAYIKAKIPKRNND